MDANGHKSKPRLTFSNYFSNLTVETHMNKLMVVLGLVFAQGQLDAQTNVWQASPGHTQVPIWPGAVPDAQPVPGPEFVTNVLMPGGGSWIEVGTRDICGTTGKTVKVSH
jgi:hypothetical protein